MTVSCITNHMVDAGSCTRKGQHLSDCDGNEYQWVEVRQREETTGRLCGGCLPREARHGLLCSACWGKVQSAFEEWGPFSKLIAGVDRAVQRDNGGVRGQSVGYVPLPGTMLAVDEIESYLRTMTGSLDVWVSWEAGARDAVRFARSVAAAIRTHAVEERPHRVNRTRCTECRRLTLVWNPTTHPGADVTVTCSNPECGAELDHDSFEKVASIERPCCRKCAGDVCADGECRCHDRTVPDGDWLPGKTVTQAFDPRDPKHQELLQAGGAA